MDEITKFENSKVNVIVTTPVLDNGINLKSEKLKNIVICTDNNISFIQMLGRKRRINNLEKVNLYIPSENTTMFIKRKNNIENKMNDISRVSRPQLNNHVTSVLYYNNDTRVANSYRAGVFPLTYYFDNCAYTQYRVSELSMLQMQFLWNNYNKIIERFETEGENAFIYEQLSWVNLEYDQSRWMYDNSYAKNKDKLENILINYVNKNLSKAEFENIKEEIRSIIRTINTDVRSNRMSTKQANEGLEVFNSRYRFDDKEHKVVQILNNKENLFEENEACYLFESL